jgi:predicted LPLAT superfamily acyltransferase
MPTWQGRSKGNRLGYRIFVWLIHRFGVFPAYFLLRFVTLYYFFFSFRTSAPIYTLYRKKLGFGISASLGSLYRNYYVFGQSLIDKALLFSDMKSPFRIDFDGEEHLLEMARRKRGGLLLSAHIGNWDIAGNLLRRLGTRVHILMYDGEQPAIRQYLESATGVSSARIIIIREDLSHMYKISEALGAGELVCIHADRYLQGNKTLDASFLGQRARFPAGPFLIAARFKVPVSFVFAIKESNLHYHFFASELQDYSGGGKRETPGIILGDFVIEMERKLRAYPDQWFNYYDFWE